MSFTEQDIQAAIEAFQRPIEEDLAVGWEKINQIDQLTIYRRSTPDDEGYEYMARGH
jgi:hypothetical protein